jgi:hypothetical protein
MQEERKKMKPFKFYDDTFVKLDPVKTLANLKRQKIFPLMVQSDEIIPQANNELPQNDDLYMTKQPLLTPIESLKNINNEA